MFPNHIHGGNNIPYSHRMAVGEHDFTSDELIQPFFQLPPPDKSTHSISMALEHQFLPSQITVLTHHLGTSDTIAPATFDGYVYDPKRCMKEIVYPTPAPGRKRSSNKERHSKIITSQGLRDRRMRLSVDVASKFFALQDKLGFDKASKTVGWLLNKSKAAIQELPRNNLSQANYSTFGYVHSSSQSEDDLSGIDETAGVDHQNKYQKNFSATTKGKRQKAISCSIDRESRAVARAKARERTREKNKRLENPHQILDTSTPQTTHLRTLEPLGFSTEESRCRSVADDEKYMELSFDTNESSKLGFCTFSYDQHMTMSSGGLDSSSLAAINRTDFFSENWDVDIIKNSSTGYTIPYPYMHI